jgi:hypothetical protein
MTAGWVDDQITIRLVLDRVGEPAARLAAATDAFVRAFAARAGATAWGVVDGPAWTGDGEAFTAIVRDHPSSAATGEADPTDGYTYTLTAQHGGTALAVGVSVGGPVVGRRLPQQTVRGSLINPDGTPVDRALADAFLASLIEAWQPLFANLSATDINQAAHRGNWKIPAGYRVWLRDGTVALPALPDGVTSQPFAGGTLLAVPDDWPPDQIAQTLAQTYERNGVDVVPH